MSGKITEQELHPSLLGKINAGGGEAGQEITDIRNSIGELTSLETSAKDSIVSAVNELFTSASDGKSRIASAIAGKGITASGSDTFEELATKIETPALVDTADASASASQILSGRTAYVNGSKITGSMANRGAGGTVIPGTTNQTKSSGYYSSSITIQGDSNLVSSNIKSGASIFGVSGSSSVVDTSDTSATADLILSGYTAYTKGSKITGTMPSRGTVQITPRSTTQTGPSGHYAQVRVLGDANLAAENIKSGVSIFGVNGNYSPSISIGTHNDNLRFSQSGYNLPSSGVLSQSRSITVPSGGATILVVFVASLYSRAHQGTSRIKVEGFINGSSVTTQNYTLSSGDSTIFRRTFIRNLAAGTREIRFEVGRDFDSGYGDGGWPETYMYGFVTHFINIG